MLVELLLVEAWTVEVQFIELLVEVLYVDVEGILIPLHLLESEQDRSVTRDPLHGRGAEIHHP